MYQSLPLSVWRPSLSVSSGTPIIPISCLLARIKTTASLSSSSASILWSSSLAMSTRSRSDESTTKIRAWVFWKQCFQSWRILSCPPTSHTVNFTFWNSTVQTLKPIVGTDDTTQPSFILYRMVVFPAASSPSIKALSSLFPNSPSKNLVNAIPIFLLQSYEEFGVFKEQQILIYPSRKSTRFYQPPDTPDFPEPTPPFNPHPSLTTKSPTQPLIKIEYINTNSQSEQIGLIPELQIQILIGSRFAVVRQHTDAAVLHEVFVVFEVVGHHLQKVYVFHQGAQTLDGR